MKTHHIKTGCLSVLCCIVFVVVCCYVSTVVNTVVLAYGLLAVLLPTFLIYYTTVGASREHFKRLMLNVTGWRPVGMTNFNYFRDLHIDYLYTLNREGLRHSVHFSTEIPLSRSKRESVYAAFNQHLRQLWNAGEHLDDFYVSCSLCPEAPLMTIDVDIPLRHADDVLAQTHQLVEGLIVEYGLAKVVRCVKWKDADADYYARFEDKTLDIGFIMRDGYAYNIDDTLSFSDGVDWRKASLISEGEFFMAWESSAYLPLHFESIALYTYNEGTDKLLLVFYDVDRYWQLVYLDHTFSFAEEFINDVDRQWLNASSYPERMVEIGKYVDDIDIQGTIIGIRWSSQDEPLILLDNDTLLVIRTHLEGYGDMMEGLDIIASGEAEYQELKEEYEHGEDIPIIISSPLMNRNKRPIKNTR